MSAHCVKLQRNYKYLRTYDSCGVIVGLDGEKIALGLASVGV